LLRRRTVRFPENLKEHMIIKHKNKNEGSYLMEQKRYLELNLKNYWPVPTFQG
jgi:hypothetical protein